MRIGGDGGDGELSGTIPDLASMAIISYRANWDADADDDGLYFDLRLVRQNRGGDLGTFLMVYHLDEPRQIDHPAHPADSRS